MTSTINPILADFGLDRTTAMALSEEELARPLLQWLIRTQPKDFIPGNVANQLSSQGDRELARALMEAFAWLTSNGLFAISPGYHGGGCIFVTRRGRELAKGGESIRAERAAALVKNNLHPSIASRVWSSFVRGEYDLAVWFAFKSVEIRVRTASGFPNREIGTKLMRRAFDADGGPLADMDSEKSEREAIAHLFSGAIGALKNPQSHREVEIADAAEAAELVMSACHLLRIVDARVASRSRVPAPNA